MPSTRFHLALGLVLVATACSGGQNDDPASAPAPSTTVAVAEGKVVIRDIAYNPSRATAVGKELVWTWDDRGINHTVTGDDGSFDSGRKTEGEFRHTFDRPGEFAYHCQVHARMKGTVVVTP